MKDVESINKTPKSAMALYVKIYCQKQAKIKNKQYSLIDATKSWVSLSKTDKQYFKNVFKEYKTKMRKFLASNLLNAQLYMKKRDNPKRLCNSKTKSMDYIIQPSENTGNHEDNVHSICYTKDENNEMNIQNENESLTNCNTISVTENVASENAQPDPLQIFSEPTPPVRSSMELFEIIKHRDETTEHLSWADLTKLQKQRYQRALLSIKNDYIKQYTAYLKQMTPEQLFQYYKTKISGDRH